MSLSTTCLHLSGRPCDYSVFGSCGAYALCIKCVIVIPHTVTLAFRRGNRLTPDGTCFSSTHSVSGAPHTATDSPYVAPGSTEKVPVKIKVQFKICAYATNSTFAESKHVPKLIL